MLKHCRKVFLSKKQTKSKKNCFTWSLQNRLKWDMWARMGHIRKNTNIHM